MTARKPRFSYLIEMEKHYKRQQPVIESARKLRDAWDAGECPDNLIQNLFESIQNLDKEQNV